jgi:methylmalonyl-CoA mutase N-terminal domain/subunit
MSIKQRWLEGTYRRSVSARPERTYPFRSLSDIEVDPVYSADDLGDHDPERDLALPGEYPYTRGVHPSMYRGKLWTMRMFAGFGTAEQTNERFRSLLDAGQTGLSTAFDLPTLMGYDADHPFSRGEVGKCGVAVSSLADMELLFDGIDPERITTSMTINSPANAIWAMYLAMAERKGADLTKVGGTIQNDILKEFIAQKEYIFPPKPSVDLVIDTFEWGPKHVPRWNFVSVSGYHIREAGSTAAQELAFTLADGLHYVQRALARGLDSDEFAPRISFFFNGHNDFFEEITKFRAARRVWARQMRERFGARDPRSWVLRTHAQTAGVSLTAQQPLVNLSRVAIQALAGVLAGTNSLHTDGYDEALALPTEEAAMLALRTQQVIAYESGVANTADPLGGSYYLEALTDELERRCLARDRRRQLPPAARDRQSRTPGGRGQRVRDRGGRHSVAADRSRGGAGSARAVEPGSQRPRPRGRRAGAGIAPGCGEQRPKHHARLHGGGARPLHARRTDGRAARGVRHLRGAGVDLSDQRSSTTSGVSRGTM